MYNLRSNIASRFFRRQQGENLKQLDRWSVHSRFRLDATITPPGRGRAREYAMCCAFTPCGTRLIVGLRDGIVAVYNSKNGRYCTGHQCHLGQLVHVKTNNNGRLLFTCCLSVFMGPLSRMWSFEDNQLSVQLDFAEDEYLEFSKLNDDKIIGTKRNKATIYDTQTGMTIGTLTPEIGNKVPENRATFSHCDDLILSDFTPLNVIKNR
ncbi:Protein mahjong, partial [Pseudolycoriella hygida]